MVYEQAKCPLDIIIVGAGIGGVAAALTLGLRGHNVTILEAAPKLAEVGAGIQVSPNMYRLLDRMGVGSKIKSLGLKLDHLHVLRWQDGKILRNAKFENHFGEPFVIHRADLHNTLVDAATKLDTVDLRVNSIVVDVDFDNTSVRLEDGTVFSADVIIGGDGIKSTVRSKMLPDATIKAIPTGDATYRILVPRETMAADPDLAPFINEERAVRWIGPKRHIMAYPLRNHELYNVVLVHPDRGGLDESWTTPGKKQEMIDHYAGWDSRLERIIRSVPDDDVLEWKLCISKPLETWVKDSVALLGDACHPMLPYVAQGAAQAVEDAAALGVILSEVESTAPADITHALHVYERSRKSRAELIQQSGTDNAVSLHLEDGPEQVARDEKFRLAEMGGENPDKWGDRRMQEFMWSWDAEAAAKKDWELYTDVVVKA